MWWPFQWLIIYVLGGLTFVPLAIAVIIGYVMTYGSTPIGDNDPTKLLKAELQAQDEKDASLSRTRSSSVGTNGNGKPLSGWLTVRRQFAPSTANNSFFMPSTTTGSGEAGGVEAEDTDKADDASSTKSGTSTPAGTSTPSSTAPTTYSARIAQTYRQVMDARQGTRATVPKEYFFCVLKGSVLFLYEDEGQSECVAAICIDKYDVGVEGKERGRFSGKDAEMFAKRNAVVMRFYEEGGKTGLPVLSKGMGLGADGAEEKERDVENLPWFLFAKSNTKMEDWYLALVAASRSKPSTADVFSTTDMRALVDTIDTEPDPIPMRWLNAMLGRFFFGVYRTAALEQFIINRIMKKLSKVPRPNFLGPIVIREVNVGTFPPILSKPMLKDLTAEGTASFEVHLNYRSRPSQPNSEVRITIATTATIPTGFKPYVVDLVLAVVLKSMEGNLVMQIKKPPSNRFWYGFTHMPKMELEIQPVVSERKIQIGMVLKAIEKQLREVIAESVVLPNMDDIAFFDTSALDLRGGIFSAAGKTTSEPHKEPTQAEGGPPVAAVDIATSAEDPSSAIPEAPGLRKRNPAKAPTLDHSQQQRRDGDGEAVSSGIQRVDTAPPNMASGPSNKQVAAVQPSRKWFAANANGRPASVSSLSSVTKQDSQDSLGLTRSSSIDRKESAPIDNVAHALASGPSEATTSQRSGISENPSSPSSSRRRSIESTSSAATATKSHHGGVLGERSEIPGQSPTGTGPSLITSLRARDKQAITSQVNTARDAVKKWGVNWAAKRKVALSGLDEGVKDKPAALYRPPDEDETGLSRSAEAPKSLQDRLNAAASQARPKSGSISSSSASPVQTTKPSLQVSPGPKAIAGTSPPRWTLSSPGPTTEVAREMSLSEVPTLRPSPPKTSSNGSTPSVPMHITQPGRGKSMIVPKVVKHPGEVVGIGSSESGITRRISGSGDERPKEVKPDLTARKSSEGTGDRVPPPKLPSSKITPKASPTLATIPLEAETATSNSTPDTASEESSTKTSPSPPEADVLHRSDSAPSGQLPLNVPPPSSSAASAADRNESLPSSAEEDAEQPAVIIEPPSPSNDDGVEDVTDEVIPEKPDTAKGPSAEDALRNLVKRDEEVRSLKGEEL